MASYAVKTNVVEVRFMTATGKSCNIAIIINGFLVAERANDVEFNLIPLIGVGDNLCFTADFPNYKNRIE
jgi:hypothetical protein